MSNKYPIKHEITVNGVEMTVDEALSDTSSNPVANWLIKKLFDEGGGGGGAHNNLQPYITCYMFKRTA